MIDRLYTTAVGQDLADIRKRLADGTEVQSTFFANGKAGAIIVVPQDASVANLVSGEDGDGRVFFDAVTALRHLTVQLGWARP